MVSLNVESIASILGLILTGVGLIYAGIQLRASEKVAQGDFLLRLDVAFWRHYKIHKLLRPGGDWSVPGKGPECAEDWADVEAYIGLFERVKVLVDDRIIDLETVNRLYGYRINNIVQNKIISTEKCLTSPEEWSHLPDEERKKHGWFDFMELWHDLERIR